MSEPVNALTEQSEKSIAAQERRLRHWYILSCRHEVMFDIPAKLKDIIYCWRCNQPSRIVAFQYMFRCHGCNYQRAFGTDKAEMIRKATLHSFKYPWHVIHCRDLKGKKFKTITGKFRDTPLL